MAKDVVIDVDSLTQMVREVLRSDVFQDVLVKGQLEGLKRHSSGHVYFTLLGGSSRISCAMFRSSASSVLHWPEDGQEVAVRGGLDLYPPRGTYQLIVNRLYPLGIGDRARQKELLRKKLQEEGLFDERLKRPIPAIPDKVAVITSPTGAALQDVIRVSGERFPQTPLLVVPSVVQGVEATSAVVSCLRRVSCLSGISCVMLVRGGGSRDDLDPFDDEEVARAIRACPFPVVTGLGHQVDLTIADMAADLSAPTPSGAAERVFPDRRELQKRISYLMRVARSSSLRRVLPHRSRLTALMDFMEGRLLRQMEDNNGKLLRALESAKRLVNLKVLRAEASLGVLDGRLRALSPSLILQRGYAEVRDPDGRKISSSLPLGPGYRILIKFRDGLVMAEVIGHLDPRGDGVDARGV